MKTSKFFLTPVRAAALFAFALFTATGAWADTETVEFIGIDGQSTSHVATILTGSTSITKLDAGWYVAKTNVAYTGQLQFNPGEVNLILCDGATLSISSGSSHAILVEGNLTIYAQSGGSGALETSTTYTSSGIHANNNGNITINGGIIATSSTNGPGISTAGDIAINGGRVEATCSNDYGLRAKNITLGWRNASDRINAKTYELEGGSLSVATGQTLTDGNGHIYTGTLSASEKTAIAKTALMGTHLLYDTGTEAADNSAIIEALATAGTPTNITLTGRTLFKDDAWNTLCLPFDMTISGSVLDGATVKKLTTSNSGVSGTTLTLNFEDETTTMTAGIPYIIKWASADNLVNPTFAGVTVKKVTKNTDFNGGCFVGSYSPVDFTANDKTKLFLGAANKLHWPNATMTLGACRAYFELSNTPAPDMNFVVNFGDETTEVNEVIEVNGVNDNTWFTLDGRRIANGQQPTAKGIYIHGGHKVVVK